MTFTMAITNEPPPPYTTLPQNQIHKSPPRPNAQKHPRAQINDIEPTTCPAIQNTQRFPREFGFYNALEKHTDFVIALHARDPHALFYISTHMDTQSLPRISLYPQSHNLFSPLATASFDFYSDTVAINIYDNPISSIKAQSARTPDSNMLFIVQLPGSNSKEQFKWKNISGRDKVLGNSKTNGMKLVRSSNEQPMALWTRSSFSKKKLGKMMFLNKDRTTFGERFELMSVVTLISILVTEKATRNSL